MTFLRRLRSTRDERLHHLGVEAPSADHVAKALQRFQAAGLQTTVAELAGSGSGVAP
jgi:hypothetical protein